MHSAEIVILGPEHAGKSTLILQLKHWASSGALCATLADPSLLIVSPTTGQEVDSFILAHRSRTVPTKPSRDITSAIAAATAAAKALVAAANMAVSPLAACFAEDGINLNLDAVSIIVPSPSLLSSSSSEKIVEESSSSSSAARSYHPCIFCSVKEIGGRMAALWRKFIPSGVEVPKALPADTSAAAKDVSTIQSHHQQQQQQQTQHQQQQIEKMELPFNKLIFVVDVVSPQFVPFAAMELRNTMLRIQQAYTAKSAPSKRAEPASPTAAGSDRIRTLVFINKVRSAATMPTSEVLRALRLQDNTDNANNWITIVVGDTWSGEGIPEVVNWIMQL